LKIRKTLEDTDMNMYTCLYQRAEQEIESSVGPHSE